MHEGKPIVERRSDQRNIGSIPIVCRLFSSSCDETIDGVILNFGSNGFYAELKAQVNPGTVIAVRMNGISLGSSIEGKLCSLALVEVRWSRPKLMEGDVRYATGMMYLTAY
jgi:hypothetical protein